MRNGGNKFLSITIFGRALFLELPVVSPRFTPCKNIMYMQKSVAYLWNDTERGQ